MVFGPTTITPASAALACKSLNQSLLQITSLHTFKTVMFEYFMYDVLRLRGVKNNLISVQNFVPFKLSQWMLGKQI